MRSSGWARCAGFAVGAWLVQACAANGGDAAGTTAIMPGGASVGAPAAAQLPGADGAAGSAAPSAQATSLPSSNAGGANAGPNPGTTSGNANASGAASPLPCDVSRVVANNCQACHASTPKFGAPMPLVSHDDFMAQAKTRPELKVYELAHMRVNDPAKPMPPGGNPLPAADLALLNQWLTAGAVAGSPSDSACQTAPPAAVPGGDVGNGLIAEPGETCYSLQAHEAQTAGDTTPYTVHAGEYYHQFYYKSPWATGAQGTRFGARFDNVQVLHHWLLFTTAKNVADGAHEDDSGSHIGDTAQLVAGWAVGGKNVIMPDGVGFELPAGGSMLQLEWHYFNRTDNDQPDSTAVQVCTVAPGTRPKLASITWLGTEDFNGPFGMPPGETSQFGGNCTPSRTGMNATDPIHIFFVLPHMHLLGRHMTSVANRANGQKDTVYDMPFDFNQQIHHEVSIDLMPGDTITSTCTFVNDTDHAVAFGPSTTQEMCYQFAFSYPAHALENGVFSLNGATNTCW